MSDSDKRSSARSNVFLGAVLETEAGRFPVRIRNISANGALVDASSLPSPGSRVRLLRGHLSVSCDIAWETPGHAGIRFRHAVNVEDWVGRTGQSGQQRVDRIVHEIRKKAPLASDDDAPGDPSLQQMSSALDELCEELAEIPSMSQELGDVLLKLDSIAQALRKMAAS